MAYLIIPIVCFVVLAGLTWFLYAPDGAEVTREGKINDLDLYLSVLMTTGFPESSLVLKIPGYLTSLRMTFSGSATRLEMPLVTDRQQSRRERYLAILRDLNLDARLSSHEDGHEILEWDVEGPIVQTSAVVKNAFIRLFDVDPTRTFEFRARVPLADHGVIIRALEERRSGDKAELPTAATHGQEIVAPDEMETRAGCMAALAGLFLLPVPFMVAYLEFGYIAASAVVMAIVVLREIYWRWRKSGKGVHLNDAMKFPRLVLAGTTIFLADPFYLQLVPTITLSVLAVAVVLSVSFNLPKLLYFDPISPDHTKPERNLLVFAFTATCIGGAVLNEYLRTNLPLDQWVWFFAFFRIELVLGVTVTSIPLLLYMIHQIPRTDGDTPSP